MGAHFTSPARGSRPGRRRQIGILSIALGVGLLAFAFLDEDGTPVRSTSPTLPPSSEATVLGVTVAPEPTTPGAEPATPVSLSPPDDADDGDGDGGGTPTTAGSRPTTTRAPSATTTTEGPVLIPPTVVTNTVPPRPTTTTEPTTSTAPSTTTTDTSTTTTTEDAASS
jgi:hypothetical protein